MAHGLPADLIKFKFYMEAQQLFYFNANDTKISLHGHLPKNAEEKTSY